MKFKNLELYYFPSCPYCYDVLLVIQELNLQVRFVNIHEDNEARDKLYNDTKRYTVPCLYIDGQPMHESSLIIEWFRKNNDQLPKAT